MEERSGAEAFVETRVAARSDEQKAEITLTEAGSVHKLLPSPFPIYGDMIMKRLPER